MKTESNLMCFLKAIGLTSVAWSFRRLYCPADKQALVLDIGSGGNPYYRANIMCDAYLDTIERFHEKLITDRPLVLAKAENLPFRDNTFDFVIASHVLEHSKDPEKFISEMQRVGKAGYIEVPDAFFERLFNYPFHMLEITDRNNELLIRKKIGQFQDKQLWDLFENKVFHTFPRFVSENPFNFHVRYYWDKNSGGVKYKILNPEYEFDWEQPAEPASFVSEKISLKTRIKRGVLNLFRKLLSQNKRNRNIKLEDYLICLVCREAIVKKEGKYICSKCNKQYQVVGSNIPDFIS